MRLLRRMKAEAALLIALADIGGVWPVMRVTRALTALADAAVGAAVRYLLGDAARRGRLTPADPAQPEQGSGYIVLAMGKMGAHELNYSSDIDLIVFYDAAAAALPPGTEPAPFFVRLTRGWSSCCRSAPPTATCFAPICGCAPIRPRPRSRSRLRPRSTITRASARTGSARR